MKLSLLFPEVEDIDRAIARIVQLEGLGFHSAVMGHAFGFDPMTVFALAGRQTERILLGGSYVTIVRRPNSPPGSGGPNQAPPALGRPGAAPQRQAQAGARPVDGRTLL